MAIINEIKCARCDRKYSGVRSRCPYCGARRTSRGKYSEDSDNAKGKMLISVLIMAVFTVAAGVLLFTTPADAEGGNNNTGDLLPPPEDGIISEPGVYPEETPTPSPPAPTTPDLPMEVTLIEILFDGRKKEDVTEPAGTSLDFNARIEPPGIDVEITWESTNPEVFDVVPYIGGMGAKVTFIARGEASLILRAGDKEAVCIIRVSSPR